MTRYVVPALGAGVLLPWIVAAVADDAQTESTAVKRPTSISRSEYVYVGTKKCRMCHTLQHESLMASPKANSWNALRPGESAAVKRRAGLNVEKDYTVDPACLKCHAVGFGKPGGYFVPDLSDEKLARTAATRQGVGCESCHGPGSGFVEIMRDVVRRERTYNPDEVYALGRKIVRPEVCYECHNDKAICMISPDGSRHHRASRSQIEALDRRGFHKKFPFKFRERKAVEAEPARSESQSNTN